MVYTSLYAFPGVYEGMRKITPLVSVESWGGGKGMYGQCLQISCFPSMLASLTILTQTAALPRMMHPRLAFVDWPHMFGSLVVSHDRPFYITLQHRSIVHQYAQVMQENIALYILYLLAMAKNS